MGAYLARRLATLPLLLLGISAVRFALLNLELTGWGTGGIRRAPENISAGVR